MQKTGILILGVVILLLSITDVSAAGGRRGGKSRKYRMRVALVWGVVMVFLVNCDQGPKPFSTVVKDTTPPTILGTSVLGGPIPVNTPIILTFNETVNLSSVQQGISLHSSIDAQSVAGRISLQLKGREVKFTPTSQMTPGPYVLTVLGIKDTKGNVLMMPFSICFQAIAAASSDNETDTTSPTVVSTTPITDQMVHTTSLLVIRFSESIDQASAQSGISVSGVEGSILTIGAVVIFEPKEPMPIGHQTLEISGVKDLFGNIMADRHRISFQVVIIPVVEENPTKEEVSFTGAINPKAAVAIWLFEGNLKDGTENGNNGEFKNGVKITNGGKFGQALSLDGKDDYVIVKASPSLDSTAKQATTMAWIKFDKPGKKRNQCCFDDQFVVGWRSWKNIINVFGAGRNDNWGKVEIGSGQLAPNWSISPKTVNDNKWHHLAFAYDGKKKVLYIDGEVQIDRAATGEFGVKGMDVIIGGAVAERFAKGLIDEVGIFKVALSKADVKTIMKKGLGRSLGTLPVTPKSRLTTVWARIRSN